MQRLIFVRLCLAACLALSLGAARAQTRLSDPNTLSWLASFNSIAVSPKTGIYAEGAIRREGPVEGWQQYYVRGGIQRKLGRRFSGIVGYGYFHSYPYGEYPPGPYPVGEHRVWQQLSWDDAGFNGVSLNHRIRTEQRFIQQVPQAAAERRVDGYNYLNRVRYQLRATIPLSYYAPAVPVEAPQTPATPAPVRKTRTYLAAYDEIFIGFGKKVGQNIFDQNRIGLLFGYVFDEASRVRMEGGYFNQTVLQGGEVGRKEVVQYNHGLVISAYYTLPAKPRQ